ncbi:MAG: sulfurtransferase [Gammaproteobacteria bacterium HGW-Gammaproteobacteria-11]|nr:MAG: sulfurtransferase [Gammaproteobacteria bacterium HGW-Gammaproteobacteria-11]
MRALIGSLILLLVSAMVQADDMAISAEEVFAKVQQSDSQLLFVDVRDPVEIMFVGFTDAVHINIPYLLVDRSQWDEERGVYRITRNPNFLQEIGAALAERGLAQDAEIVTLCRSGSERGEPSAQFLRENGFPNARYVIDGFQGPSIKEGPQAGFRLQAGWQNSGLPWSPRMNPDKMYRP